MLALPHLQRPADFERALKDRHSLVAKSPRFVLLRKQATEPFPTNLSTGLDPVDAGGEEILPPPSVQSPSGALDRTGGFVPSGPAWARLGVVVPKRFARRAVTRNLIKRQMYAAAERHREALLSHGPADWVWRLRAPIDRQAFPSAASDALRLSVRTELERLMQDAWRRLARGRP